MMDRLDDEVLETGGDDEKIAPNSSLLFGGFCFFLKSQTWTTVLFTANIVKLKQSRAGCRRKGHTAFFVIFIILQHMTVYFLNFKPLPMIFITFTTTYFIQLKGL